MRETNYNFFDKYANSYEKAALIQGEIGNRLFDRLAYYKMQPRFILDLGCGTGLFTKKLLNLYPHAQIFAFDLAKNMLSAAKSSESKPCFVQGDMHHLPFETGFFDLIFSNQVIHWSSTLPALLREINRVMQVDGCFIFSTLGPDTFLELKRAWSSADQYTHVNVFEDMHTIGDCLLKEQFMDPVVDMEKITLHYPSLRRLLTDLREQGVKNIHPKRNKGLTGKQAWQRFQSHYSSLCTAEGKYPLTYEVIYGQAWRGSQRRINDQEIEMFFPLEKLRR